MDLIMKPRIIFSPETTTTGAMKLYALSELHLRSQSGTMDILVPSDSNDFPQIGVERTIKIQLYSEYNVCSVSRGTTVPFELRSFFSETVELL